MLAVKWLHLITPDAPPPRPQSQHRRNEAKSALWTPHLSVSTCFPNKKKKSLDLIFRQNKWPRHPLTFPDETGEAWASKAASKLCLKSEAGSNRATWHIVTTLRWPLCTGSKRNFCLLLPRMGDTLEMGSFPSQCHRVLCKMTSHLTTGNKSFLGHRKATREGARLTNAPSDWSGSYTEGTRHPTNFALVAAGR